jgi:hypothetical protein
MPDDPGPERAAEAEAEGRAPTSAGARNLLRTLFG